MKCALLIYFYRRQNPVGHVEYPAARCILPMQFVTAEVPVTNCGVKSTMFVANLIALLHIRNTPVERVPSCAVVTFKIDAISCCSNSITKCQTAPSPLWKPPKRETPVEVDNIFGCEINQRQLISMPWDLDTRFQYRM
jgi:hypothetical protein